MGERLEGQRARLLDAWPADWRGDKTLYPGGDVYEEWTCVVAQNCGVRIMAKVICSHGRCTGQLELHPEGSRRSELLPWCVNGEDYDTPVEAAVELKRRADVISDALDRCEYMKGEEARDESK